jgi:uncharacterized protein (TIGR03067 family)
MTRTICGTGYAVVVAFLCLGCGNKSTPTTENTSSPSSVDSKQPQTPSSDQVPKQDGDLIRGTWIIESAVFEGKSEPDEMKEVSMIIKRDRMIIKTPGREEEMSFKIDPTKKIKTIELFDADDDPKDISPGIYELDGDHLKICFVRDSKGARPTAFESKPGSTSILWVLKRDRNAPPLMEEKEPNVAEFPTAIIGKWKFTQGETRFGVFASDTEFTKDGRVLQLDSRKNEWIEKYKYRFDKGVLVLIFPKKEKDGQTEYRFKITNIAEDTLISKSPSGKLVRLK